MPLTPALQEGPVTVYTGHSLDLLRELPEDSVHCVITSPPYYGLRDYGTAEWVGGDPDCLHRQSELRRGVNLAQSAVTTRGGAKKVAETGWLTYRDVCGTCGAVRVEPTVWGGVIQGCEHEWGEPHAIGDPNRGVVGSTLAGGTRNQEGASRWRASSSFCRLCGGWRGALGLEPTPDLYIEHIVQVFREVRRVLRRDGTCWLNIGDTYAASRSGPVGEHSALGGQREHRDEVAAGRWANRKHTRERHPDLGIKPKDLMLIPARVSIALQQDGWWVRKDVAWTKPNPMPESVVDRPTSSWEHVFMLTKRDRYFWDLEAVREANVWPGENRISTEPRESHVPGAPPHRGLRASELRPVRTSDTIARAGEVSQQVLPGQSAAQHRLDRSDARGLRKIPGAPNSPQSIKSPYGQGFTRRAEADAPALIRTGRNMRDVWNVATEPYPAAHFATFPSKLIGPPIEATTSERGCCPQCGAPWRRLTLTDYENPGNRTTNGPRSEERKHLEFGSAGYAVRLEKAVATTGWQPDCWCGGEQPCPTCDGSGRVVAEDGKRELCPTCREGLRKQVNGRVPVPVAPPTPCTVLDPFAGSGTTLAVARKLGRRAIGLELNPKYLELIHDRISETAYPLLEMDGVGVLGD